jgi:hypothetical protein
MQYDLLDERTGKWRKEKDKREDKRGRESFFD